MTVTVEGKDIHDVRYQIERIVFDSHIADDKTYYAIKIRRRGYNRGARHKGCVIVDERRDSELVFNNTQDAVDYLQKALYEMDDAAEGGNV